MNTEQPTANTTPNGRVLRATMVAMVIAGIISIGLTRLGVSLGWPHPSAISLGVFIFLFPILTPFLGDKRPPNWPWTLTFGAVVALIAGYFASLLD